MVIYVMFYVRIFLVGVLFFIASCEGRAPDVQIPSGGPPAIPKSFVQNEPTEPLVTKTAFLKLAQKSGCLACHSIDMNIVGPAWNDVSERYNSVEYIKNTPLHQQKNILKERVAYGSKGNWKDIARGASMPAYYPRISQNNISRLVDYILDELHTSE